MENTTEIPPKNKYEVIKDRLRPWLIRSFILLVISYIVWQIIPSSSVSHMVVGWVFKITMFIFILLFVRFRAQLFIRPAMDNWIQTGKFTQENTEPPHYTKLELNFIKLGQIVGALLVVFGMIFFVREILIGNFGQISDSFIN